MDSVNDASAPDGFDASTFVFAPRAASGMLRRELVQRRRVFVAVFVAHALVLVAMLVPIRREAEVVEPGLRVEFIMIPRTQSPTPPSPMPARVRPPPHVSPPPPRVARPRSTALQAVDVAPRDAESMTAEAPAQPATAARLFDDSGSIVLPEGAFEALQKNISDDRVFDYQIAGLAKAKTAFDRRPPLVYEPSLFESGMKPTRGLLTDVLEIAVSAGTLDISIPFPGDPSRKIVCSVAVLALGGSCGIAGGFTGYVEEDDPNTLSAKEEAQCSAWWEKIVNTNSQEIWLRTRQLYDLSCRPKPF